MQRMMLLIMNHFIVLMTWTCDSVLEYIPSTASSVLNINQAAEPSSLLTWLHTETENLIGENCKKCICLIACLIEKRDNQDK